MRKYKTSTAVFPSTRPAEFPNGKHCASSSRETGRVDGWAREMSVRSRLCLRSFQKR